MSKNRTVVGTNRSGEKIFTSKKDGDRSPATRQTTYTQHRGGFLSGGASKNKSTYNPSKGRFNR